MIEITVCVVNYLGEQYLPETLKSLTMIEAPLREILLVDNASPDRSLEVARQVARDVRVIELEENMGPSVARNVGFVESRSDWILFLDNDVRPDPETPGVLVRELLRCTDAVAATPRLEYESHPGLVQYAGADSHVLGMQTLRHADKQVSEIVLGPGEQGSLVSACVLFHRGRWGPSPPFDEQFFMYFEDHEFGLRSRMLGHRLIVVPEVRCLHGTGTEGISIRKMGSYSSVRIGQTIRNRWQILIKLYEIRTLALLLPSLAMFEAFQLIGSLKRGWLRHWLVSAGWIVRRFPDLIRTRRIVQQRRRVSDSALLTAGTTPLNPALLESALESRLCKLLDVVTRVNWDWARRWMKSP